MLCEGGCSGTNECGIRKGLSLANALCTRAYNPLNLQANVFKLQGERLPLSHVQRVLRLSSEDIAAALCSDYGLPVDDRHVYLKTAIFHEREGTDTLRRDDSWVGGWPHPQQFMENYILYGKWGISTG